MVRLLQLVTLATLPLSSQALFGALRDGGQSVLRHGLGFVGLNSSQIERVMKVSAAAVLPPHPYAGEYFRFVNLPIES